MRSLMRILASDRSVKIFALLFFIEMGVFFALSKDKVKVLILHSYTPEYTWSRNIDRGLMRVLSNKGAIINYRHHYMAPKDADKKQHRRAQKVAHRHVRDFQPDFIIAIDDYANALVARHYVGHRSIDIIFAGVNGSVEPYGYEGAPNVTGIYERKPIRALVDLINVINQYDKRSYSVIFVSDKSTSVKHDAEYMKTADWGNQVSLKGHIATDNFADWKEIILNLSDDIDYLMVSGYRNLKSADNPNKNTPPGEVARWTVLNSKKPVVGLNVFNSRDGVPLSVGVSPYEQGEVAGNMLLDLIKTGKPAGKFDHVHPKQYLISINDEIKQHAANIPALLKAFAKSTNNYYGVAGSQP